MQTLLIAGNPLEPFMLQRRDKICSSVNAEKIKGLGNQQPRLE